MRQTATNSSSPTESGMTSKNWGAVLTPESVTTFPAPLYSIDCDVARVRLVQSNAVCVKEYAPVAVLTMIGVVAPPIGVPSPSSIGPVVYRDVRNHRSTTLPLSLAVPIRIELVPAAELASGEKPAMGM